MNEVTKKEAWVWAVRPKTLTVAAVSVFVGTALAFAKSGRFSSLLFLAMLLTSIALQAASNLINDAADSERGSDTKERIGFPRATQMGWLTPNEVKRGAFIAFLLSFLFALPIFFLHPYLLPLFLLSAAAAWGYSGGPYPLAYHGLGELFVMFFFGWVITGVSDFIQSGSYDLLTLLAGTQAGALPVVILSINNLRDIHQDRKANKRTLIAQYGIHFGKMEITVFTLLPFLLSPLWMPFGISFAAILPLSILPLAMLMLQAIWKQEPGAIYNRYFGLAALVHLLFGTILSLSFLL